MAASVTIGGAAATSVVVVSDTEITVVTPAGAEGSADVVVTTDGGSDTLADGFTYEAPPPPVPTVTAVNPTTGAEAGGETVTVTGTGFTEGA